MINSIITTHHLSRLAIIYVRQSDPKQVRKNKESQAYQYQLAERAKALSWPDERIRVIDSDLGVTGATKDKRDGYKSLLAEVSLGKIGIIFGWEVSRLARNNSDWYQLLDLAALFGTLIADAEGIYDPRSYNDRILLGLKGTMSEAELHLIKMRLESGRMSQVKRGDYRQRLPAGLERVQDGIVMKDPDSQVRETIELVFRKFSELGSCAKVMRYFAQEKIKIPRRLPGGKIIFKIPTNSSVLDIVRNPAYAGAFVYGRRKSDPRNAKRGFRVPLDDWIHIEQDVYPAYITWQQFLDYSSRISQNYAAFINQPGKANGAPRNGLALLQGLTMCGNCGWNMKVNYAPNPWYFCDHKKKSVNGDYCPGHPAGPMDEAVLAAFFKAISPVQIDALESALTKKKEERAQLERHWQKVLKRAQFKSQQAQERYVAVDARNRLVAESLEAQWENSLHELRQLQAEYDDFSNKKDCDDFLSPELRERVQSISTSLPQLWLDGRISPMKMKELIRSLIDSVVLKKIVAEEVEVRIVWVSGGYWTLPVTKTIHKFSTSSKFEIIVSRIHSMWQELKSDEEIARQLTLEGFRSPRGATFLKNTVQSVRLKNGWNSLPKRRDSRVTPEGYLTPTNLARQLEINSQSVYKYIKKGFISDDHILRDKRYYIKDCNDMYNHLALSKASKKSSH